MLTAGTHYLSWPFVKPGLILTHKSIQQLNLEGVKTTQPKIQGR